MIIFGTGVHEHNTYNTTQHNTTKTAAYSSAIPGCGPVESHGALPCSLVESHGTLATMCIVLLDHMVLWLTM